MCFCLLLPLLLTNPGQTVSIRSSDTCGFGVFFEDETWNQTAALLGFQIQSVQEGEPAALWFGPYSRYVGSGKSILWGPEGVWQITRRESKRERPILGILESQLIFLNEWFERDENDWVLVPGTEAETPVAFEVKTYSDLKSLSGQYAQGRIDAWFGARIWTEWMAQAKGEALLWEKTDQWVLVADDSLSPDLLRKICRVAQDRLADLDNPNLLKRWNSLLRANQISQRDTQKWAESLKTAWSKGPYAPQTSGGIAGDSTPYWAALNWIPSQKEKVVFEKMVPQNADQ